MCPISADDVHPNGFVCSVDGVRPKIDNETLRKLKDLYIA